ncbi:50S ribosomal protein L19e [Candidatus Woesearchaeota archaeon]|nr:50S ribosomal protein L19e [Candidatus Woesearchaeota archaeon]
MELKIQKRLAAQVLKCSPKRIKFDVERLEEIKEAITKADIRSLIGGKGITRSQKKGVSRLKAKIRHLKKKEGRYKGFGSRKGRNTARLPPKRKWMNAVRLQRRFLKMLKAKKNIDNAVFYELYAKVKGGFFRSKRHLELYIQEHKLARLK